METGTQYLTLPGPGPDCPAWILFHGISVLELTDASPNFSIHSRAMILGGKHRSQSSWERLIIALISEIQKTTLEV